MSSNKNKITTVNIHNPTGRPPFIRSSKQMLKLSEEYFKKCDEANLPYTCSGLALYLGFADRQSLIYYGKKERFYSAVKKAKSIIQARLEQLLYTPGRPTAGIIFSLKNNFGWKDIQEVHGTQQHEHRVIIIPEKKPLGAEVDISKDNKIEPPKKELPEAKN